MKNSISIPEFYSNKTIFLTGGSGFIGKVFIEKLLRCCPDLKTIYLLMRPKKGKTPEERIKEITDLPLFDLVRKSNPENFSKLKLIPGDCSQLNLGLDPSDRLKLIEETDLIFHGAASIRFDDPLDKAVLLNTRGTREMALLALEMQHLQVFVHISTTYCNSDRFIVNEELYPAHADWRKTIEIAENCDRPTINILTKKYIETLPNTYTFAKQLGEHVVCDLCVGKIPVVVFRPSIVVSTHKDPIPGWIDNLNGPIGLNLAGGKGIIRTTYVGKNITSDCIPVDKVVNAMIVSSWKKGLENNKSVATFCNASWSNIMDVTYDDMAKVGIMDVLPTSPINNMVWYPNLTLTSCYTYYFIRIVLFQILPALLIDGVLKLAGRKPMLLNIQRKIYVATYALKYFMHNQWIFTNNNVINQEKLLLKEDCKVFGNYAKKINLSEFMVNAGTGLQLYLLNETTASLSNAKIHANRMWVASKIFNAVWYFTILWILWKIDIVAVLIQYWQNFIEYWVDL